MTRFASLWLLPLLAAGIAVPVETAAGDLLADLRVAGQSDKSVMITHIGQVVSMDLYIRVTGANDDYTDDGLWKFYSSFESTNVNCGSVLGSMRVTATLPFCGMCYQDSRTGGVYNQDLDGDGDLDLGSANHRDANGWFLARAGSFVSAEGGGLAEFHVATLSFTVTDFLSPGEDAATDINASPRLDGHSLWLEDGQPKCRSLSVPDGVPAGQDDPLKPGAPVSLVLSPELRATLPPLPPKPEPVPEPEPMPQPPEPGTPSTPGPAQPPEPQPPSAVEPVQEPEPPAQPPEPGTPSTPEPAQPPEPQPPSTPEPVQEPAAEPPSIPQPDPATAPVSEPAAQPAEPVPEPVAQPEPAVTPSRPEPEPSQPPAGQPGPAEEPAPTAAPDPEPAQPPAEPAAEPVAQPDPAVTPSTPEPEAAQPPAAEPEPAQEPAPTKAPDPEPAQPPAADPWNVDAGCGATTASGGSETAPPADPAYDPTLGDAYAAGSAEDGTAGSGSAGSGDDDDSHSLPEDIPAFIDDGLKPGQIDMVDLDPMPYVVFLPDDLEDGAVHRDSPVLLWADGDPLHNVYGVTNASDASGTGDGVNASPEPATLGLLALGAAAMLVRRKRP